MKRKFQFGLLKALTKILLVCYIDKECKWRHRVTKLGNYDLFEIRIYNSIDTFSLDMISRDHCHASSGFIGERIREIYEGVGHQYCPKDIIADI